MMIKICIFLYSICIIVLFKILNNLYGIIFRLKQDLYKTRIDLFEMKKAYSKLYKMANDKIIDRKLSFKDTINIYTKERKN